MKVKLFFGVLVLAVLVVFPISVFAGDDANPGDIVINEFITNPDTISDTNGEWVEIHNTTDSAINIDGWELSDNGSDAHVIENGGTLSVPANGKLTLCRNDDVDNNGGVACDYEYENFVLGNSGDEIILTDEGDEEIARLDYPNTAVWNTSGRSSFYIPSGDPPVSGYFDDNGDTSRWGRTEDVSANLYGTSLSNYGTPGEVNTQSGDAPTALTISKFTGESTYRSPLLLLVGGATVLLAGALFLIRRRKAA